jgi:hypothetical protein
MNLYRLRRGRMREAGKVHRKHYRIDVAKLNRAKRVLGTTAETETIHRALELVADEAALAKVLRALVIKGHGNIEALDGDREASGL